MTRQQKPADRRPHQGRECQSAHHGPQTALSTQFPFFHPTQPTRGRGRWRQRWKCWLRHRNRLRGQRHSPIRPGHWTRLFRHRHRFERCQCRCRISKTLLRILAQQSLQRLLEVSREHELLRPAPTLPGWSEQLFRRSSCEQHKRRNPESVQIHPGRTGFTAALGSGRISRGSPRQWVLPLRLHQAKIQKHRQSIRAAAQQVAGIHITVHQAAAVHHGQHRQQLTQQQQHFPRAKQHLALLPLMKQLRIAHALLPITDGPQGLAQLQLLTTSRNLGMQDRLQHRPVPLQALFGHGALHLAQNNRDLACQKIHTTPEGALNRIWPGQALLQSVALHQHCAGNAQNPRCIMG